jgi:hypothetical protein
MNDSISSQKTRIALLVSLAVNIFLVAFVLGQFSGHERFMPLPMEPQGMFQAHMPPGFAHPPIFGPGDIFEPNEIRADEARMSANFEKMEDTRKAFAAQLQAGPVSKEEVLKHFAAMDEIMEGIKKEAQERAANKISSMSEEERKRLAQFLTSHDGEPPRPMPFDQGPPR